MRGLNPHNHYQYNREFVDYDYTAKLSDEDAEWLANFSDNYYSGRFKADDDKNPCKDRTECYRGARERRRCLMSGRFKSRVQLSDSDYEGLEITDIGVAINAKKESGNNEH